MKREDKGQNERDSLCPEHCFPMQMCHRVLLASDPTGWGCISHRAFCDPEKANEKMCFSVIQTVSISCQSFFKWATNLPGVFLPLTNKTLRLPFLWALSNQRVMGPDANSKPLSQRQPRSAISLPPNKSPSLEANPGFLTQADEAVQWFLTHFKIASWQYFRLNSPLCQAMTLMRWSMTKLHQV